jgi:hypothetical protein
MSSLYLSRFPQKLGAAKESFREQAQLSALTFSSGRVPMSAVTRQRTCLVQGRTISYREAGDVSAPAILLLHGLRAEADVVGGDQVELVGQRSAGTSQVM